jgi:hypothetical protein
MIAEPVILKIQESLPFRLDRPKMTRPEAAQCRDDILRHDFGFRARLLDFHERGGWKGLGYSTVEECAAVEFKMSRPQYFRLLEAAKVDRNLREATEKAREAEDRRQSPIGDSKPKPAPVEYRPIPESHARELSKAPPSMQAEIHQEVTAKGSATAKDYKEAIEKKGISATVTKKERGTPRDDEGNRQARRQRFLAKAIKDLRQIQQDLNSAEWQKWAIELGNIAFRMQADVRAE